MKHNSFSTGISFTFNRPISLDEENQILEMAIEAIGNSVQEDEKMRELIGHIAIDGTKEGVLHEFCGE